MTFEPPERSLIITREEGRPGIEAREACMFMHISLGCENVIVVMFYVCYGHYYMDVRTFYNNILHNIHVYVIMDIMNVRMIFYI